MIHDEWIITVQSWTYYEAEWSQEQAKCSADHDAGVTTCFSKTFYATKAFSWMCAMSLTRDWIDLNLAACRRTVGPRWAWALLKVGDSLRTSLSASSLYTGGAGLQTEPCKSQFLVQRSSEAEGPVYWVQELSQLLWASKLAKFFFCHQWPNVVKCICAPVVKYSCNHVVNSGWAVV